MRQDWRGWINLGFERAACGDDAIASALGKFPHLRDWQWFAEVCDWRLYRVWVSPVDVLAEKPARRLRKGYDATLL